MKKLFTLIIIFALVFVLLPLDKVFSYQYWPSGTGLPVRLNGGINASYNIENSSRNDNGIDIFQVWNDAIYEWNVKSDAIYGK